MVDLLDHSPDDLREGRAAHFLTRSLKRVSTEMSLQVLAYSLKRVIAITGIGALISAARA